WGRSSSGARRAHGGSSINRSSSGSSGGGLGDGSGYAAASARVSTSSHMIRTWRGSSIATVIGNVAPGSGHLATGTRGSRILIDCGGRPGASMRICISQRPYSDEVGGSETLRTYAVPATHARVPLPSPGNVTEPIARTRSTTPSTTIDPLDMPRPNSMMNTATVPRTAATILRPIPTGWRPFATVDLPGLTRQARWAVVGQGRPFGRVACRGYRSMTGPLG